jgi:hypothetical protein
MGQGSANFSQKGHMVIFFGLVGHMVLSKTTKLCRYEVKAQRIYKRATWLHCSKIYGQENFINSQCVITYSSTDFFNY